MKKLVLSCLFTCCVLSSYSLVATADEIVIDHSQKARKIEGHKTLGRIEIIAPKALNYLNENTQVVELATGFKWTEGPLWLDDSQTLIFSDIPDNKIYQYHDNKGLSVYLDKSGATGLVAGDYSQGSNGLLLNPAGQLVLLQQGDRRVAVMNAPLSKPQGKFITIAGSYQNLRLNSPNDAVYDQQGNLFFTDPPYGLAKQLDDVRKELDFQGVYRLSNEGKLTLLDKTLTYPNGIAVSPDNKTLYVAVSDPKQPVWVAYDIQADGSVNNKRIFHDARDNNPEHDKGMPDGMAVHSSGVVFATGPGGVWLFSETGRLLAKIHTGKLTANCTLSADEKQLFLTAHNSVLKVNLN